MTKTVVIRLAFEDNEKAEEFVKEFERTSYPFDVQSNNGDPIHPSDVIEVRVENP